MKGWIFCMALLLGGARMDVPVRVPYDRASVMIDGRFGKGEWRGATRLPVNDSVSLLVKQDEENLYLCLRAATPQPALVMVDLYLAHSGGLLNLHASAKLGERSWNGTSYGDWVWWNNDGWQANVARIDKIEERKFLRDEAKEFQLRKARFKDKQLALMFDISYPPSMAMTYPAAADTADRKGWLLLEL